MTIDIARLYASCPPGIGVPWARCDVCNAPIRSDDTACTGHPRHARTPPTLRLYATHTRTRRNLAEFTRRGIRLIVGPDQLRGWSWGIPPIAWALDNGAWSAHTRGTTFDTSAFRDALRRWGVGADWIVCPDIVCGGATSLSLSLSWLDEVCAYARAVIAVQDGMTADDLAPHVGPHVGVFVGGSTTWKESSLPMWGALKRATGCYLHVGRVNTARRIQLAIDAGADSADGTSLSRYSVNANRLDTAARGTARLPLFPRGNDEGPPGEPDEPPKRP